MGRKRSIISQEIRLTKDGNEKTVPKTLSMTETRYRGYEMLFGNMDMTVSSGFDWYGKKLLIKAIKTKKLKNPSEDLLMDLGLKKRKNKYE